MIGFNAIHAEITWTLSDDGTLTISGTDMPDYKNISNYAPWYSQRTEIKNVIIENGVKNIGGYAFYNMDIISITIPNSVTNIGSYALSGCTGLTSIIIPNSVKSIGEAAFNYCRKLISVTIGNSVTSIGNGTFNNCFALTSVTIGNSVTSIGDEAFRGCMSLTSITIPNSVTSIGYYAFYGCSNLASITFSNSVTNIGIDAFHETKWYGAHSNELIYAGSVLYGYKGTMPENTKINIKEGTTTIAPNAFNSSNQHISGLDYSRLKSIIIPNSVKSIGEAAFQDCKGLTTITIPNSVTNVGAYAFKGCYGLTSVTIGNSVTSIGNYAFSGCKGFTSVTIPESVTSIGSNVFDVAKLRNIVIKAKTPPSGGFAFSGQSYYHTILMIPEGSWDAYAYSDNWYQFINIREMVYNAVNLTNSKAYTMKSATDGSYLFYDSVNDCVGLLSEYALDDTEENNTWMTVEVDGKNYVYNLGAKKFLVPDKASTSKTGYSLSNTPVSIDIEDGKDAIVFGKGKEFYMVINEKLNVDEGLESQIMTSTGINEIEVESNQPTVTYNLNGQRINKSNAQKGVYIKNGKKYAK